MRTVILLIISFLFSVTTLASGIQSQIQEQLYSSSMKDKYGNFVGFKGTPIPIDQIDLNGAKIGLNISDVNFKYDGELSDPITQSYMGSVVKVYEYEMPPAHINYHLVIKTNEKGVIYEIVEKYTPANGVKFEIEEFTKYLNSNLKGFHTKTYLEDSARVFCYHGCKYTGRAKAKLVDPNAPYVMATVAGKPETMLPGVDFEVGTLKGKEYEDRFILEVSHKALITQ